MRDKSPVVPPATNSKIMQAHLRAMQKSGLTRVEYCWLHDLADDEKICGCGSELSRIGEEVSEQLDTVPA